MQLDEVGLKIVQCLHSNGRLSNVDLAKRVGLSPPPCLRRVKALEQQKYIVGYRALLNHRLLGMSVNAVLVINCKHNSKSAGTTLVQNMLACPSVLSCFSALGSDEVFLMCVVKNLDALSDFINQQLQPLPEVLKINTFIIDRVFKSDEFCVASG